MTPSADTHCGLEGHQAVSFTWRPSSLEDSAILWPSFRIYKIKVKLKVWHLISGYPWRQMAGATWDFLSKLALEFKFISPIITRSYHLIIVASILYHQSHLNHSLYLIIRLWKNLRGRGRGNLAKAAPEINTGGTQGLQSDRQLWVGGKGGRWDFLWNYICTIKHFFLLILYVSHESKFSKEGFILYVRWLLLLLSHISRVQLCATP